MKILYVINNFSGRGGAETALARLINEMTDCEHRLLPLMGQSELNRKLLVDTSVLLEPLGMQSLASVPRTLKALRRVIDEEQPNLVMSWMYMSNAMCSLAIRKMDAPVPLIWSVHHALDNFRRESVATKVSILMSRALKNQPSHIVYGGERVRRQHEARGFARTETTMIPHGVSVDKDVVRDARFEHRVGILARWHDAKDWPTMMRTMRIVLDRNADATFVLGGAGISEDNPAFVRLLAANGIDRERIRLVGLLDDTGAFYREIDILLMGSRTEAWPITLLEAMANGVAPVATDVGDARWIIGDESYVSDVGDAEGLAGNILKLLANPKECKRLAVEAREKVKANFLSESLLNCYRELFASVM